ncbi:MAG TPA: DUF4864 domain-containing protein [Chthoniobacterales bacterium]|nr:DUF4864 domain-containing protein [Chthoniobacterales bacterium]
MTPLVKASLLTFFFSLCGAALIISHHMRENAPAPVPHALFAVVNDQLTAFRAADYASAYSYAANGMQQKFTLPQFERMVRRNYAHMAEARRVEFGSVRVDGLTATVQVFFFKCDGSMRTFIYSLTAERDVWKISGVDEVESSPHSRKPAGSLA